MLPRDELSVSRVDLQAGRSALVLRGDLDATNTGIVDAHLTQLAARDELQEIVVDLSAVTFIDSSGLNLLVRHHRANRGRAEIVLGGPSEHIRRLLEVTGLDTLFPVRPPAGVPGSRDSEPLHESDTDG